MEYVCLSRKPGYVLNGFTDFLSGCSNTRVFQPFQPSSSTDSQCKSGDFEAGSVVFKMHIKLDILLAHKLVCNGMS